MRHPTRTSSGHKLRVCTIRRLMRSYGSLGAVVYLAIYVREVNMDSGTTFDSLLEDLGHDADDLWDTIHEIMSDGLIVTCGENEFRLSGS